MRGFVLGLTLAAGGCVPSGQQAPADRIEIRQSGWESLDITVSSGGDGSFERTGWAAEPITGDFRVSPGDFRSLEARLSEFRQESVPRTEASIQELGHRECPAGVPFVTDNGAIYIRWVGQDFDEHYLADLGCDQDRNADRNAKLLEAVRSLPLPTS